MLFQESRFKIQHLSHVESSGKDILIKDSSKVSQGKTPACICLSDYLYILPIAFLLILSSSYVVGSVFLKTNGVSLDMRCISCWEALDLFVVTLQKQEATYFLLCIRGFLVVLIKCSVCFLLIPAAAILWKCVWRLNCY